jgi:hypothetical protein
MSVTEKAPMTQNGKTVTINGVAVAAPEGAIGYKYADPTEDARWVYDEDDLSTIQREDPNLVVPLGDSMASAAAERGPGRPSIGPPVNVRLPVDLLAWVDARAEALGVPRAEFIRGVLEHARAPEHPGADQ